PALLRRGAERAAAERLAIDFVEGDAEQLPFGDASFDVALSTFGVMFAPDQEQTARELVRVVRPGGTIGLANWTPTGFIGGLLKRVSAYVPAPPGVASPLFWGTEERLAELFPAVRSIRSRHIKFVFRYESAEHFVDIFKNFYGPTHKAFESLDAPKQAALA